MFSDRCTGRCRPRVRRRALRENQDPQARCGTSTVSTFSWTSPRGSIPRRMSRWGFSGSCSARTTRPTRLLGQLHRDRSRPSLYRRRPLHDFRWPIRRSRIPASESRVLRFAQPESNHKGGMLAFGADGFLYVFSGTAAAAATPTASAVTGRTARCFSARCFESTCAASTPDRRFPTAAQPGATYRVPTTNPFNDGPGLGCATRSGRMGSGTRGGRASTR